MNNRRMARVKGAASPRRFRGPPSRRFLAGREGKPYSVRRRKSSSRKAAEYDPDRKNKEAARASAERPPVSLAAHNPPPAVAPAVTRMGSPSRPSRAALDTAPAVAPAIASSPLHVRDFRAASCDLGRRRRRDRRGGGGCCADDQETGESGENGKLRHGFCPFVQRER